jgi:two-component system, NarL family, sensor histidine kinase UhpB
MPSFTASTVSRQQKSNILRNKTLERNVPQHSKTRGSTFDERQLPKLDAVTKSLAAELGCVREKERQKIAGDLHDQIGQNLVLAKLRLDALRSSLGNEYAASIAGITELISHTIKDTRSLIHELYPEWLSQVSLNEALNWLAEQTEAKYGLRCAIEFTSLPKPLKKDVQEVLFQAVRELLVNVAKHAGANQVRIFCGCEKGWLRIRIVDDGDGFDPTTNLCPNPNSGGFGLMIIRARLGLVRGNLYIDSHAGTGTSVIITLPANAN